MHQLNEEVRCLRQTLSHLQYRMKQVFGQETNWQTYVLKVQNGEY